MQVASEDICQRILESLEFIIDFKQELKHAKLIIQVIS